MFSNLKSEVNFTSDDALSKLGNSIFGLTNSLLKISLENAKANIKPEKSIEIKKTILNYITEKQEIFSQRPDDESKKILTKYEWLLQFLRWSLNEESKIRIQSYDFKKLMDNDQ